MKGTIWFKNFTERGRTGTVISFFPELKNTFEEAISSQRSVDDFLGVGQVSELSPLAKEKSAAALFLGGDPGEEIGRIIRSFRFTRYTGYHILLQR